MKSSTENLTPITPLHIEQPTEVNPVVAEAAAAAPLQKSDLDAVKELAEAHAQIVKEIEKRIIGQRKVVDQLLVALFARGHTLFVGVPGLAKTLLISTLAETLNLSFQRIQFTPDLMPADITGTEILEEDHTTGRRAFRFLKGPVFTSTAACTTAYSCWSPPSCWWPTAASSSAGCRSMSFPTSTAPQSH